MAHPPRPLRQSRKDSGPSPAPACFGAPTARPERFPVDLREMRLFVGLGNPGSEYARHRHNVGFRAVDEIARVQRAGPWRRRFQGLTADATIGGEKVLILKPETYMNESGR